jgi:hypothetical protein
MQRLGGVLFKGFTHDFLYGFVDVLYEFSCPLHGVPPVDVAPIRIAQPDFPLRVLPG